MSSAGIYIHIPFCRSRCSYCDFATGLYEKDLAERYVRAVESEIRRSGKTSVPVDTIYFGGGTPSLLSAAQVEVLLAVIHDCFAVTADAEVTMEMNPGTVTPAGLNDYRMLGINRASFGAQTFDDRELARLGRSHTTTETLKTFRELREARFDNISLDLIAGLPGQSMQQWKENVRHALSLRPDHLSFYLLEVHSGTPLAEHIRRGLQPQPDEDLAAEMYEVMLEFAVAAGYRHYEISNLSLPGFEARHNTKYWTGAPYYGYGCSAHSFDGAERRWSNLRDVKQYVETIEKAASPVTEERKLTIDDSRAEAVFLGMRMMNGIDGGHYRELFGVDLRDAYRSDFERFLEAGLLELDGENIKLTRAGALMSNEVFAAFI